MTPPTIIYCIIYLHKLIPDSFQFYTGITNNLDRRMTEHLSGKTRTTNKFNKSYMLYEVKYRKFDRFTIDNYEKIFKKYSKHKKSNIIKHWWRWAG